MPPHACNHDEEFKEINTRLAKGDTQIKTIDDRSITTHDLLVEINKKLFIDNGVKCVQSRINATENIQKRMTVVIYVLSTGLVSMILGVIGRLIYSWITKT